MKKHRYFQAALTGAFLGVVLVVCMAQTMRVPVTTTTYTRNLLTNSSQTEIISFLGLSSSNVTFNTDQFTLVGSNVNMRSGPIITNALFKTAVTNDFLTASTVPYTDAEKKLVSSAVTPTELGYLSGASSAIQTQLGQKIGTNAHDANQFVWDVNGLHVKSGAIVTNLSSAGLIGTSGAEFRGAVTNLIGTAALPSITFSNDVDTGIYGLGVNQVGITTGGSLKLTVGSNVESAVPVLVPAGSLSAPGMAFSGDVNTGFYRYADDEIAMSIGGNGPYFRAGNGWFYFAGQITNTALTASRALVSDANKAMVSSSVTATELGYLSGVSSAIQTQLDGKLTLASGGTLGGALLVPAGSVSAPSVAFSTDTDTGLYRYGANWAGIAAGGQGVLRIEGTAAQTTAYLGEPAVSNAVVLLIAGATNRVSRLVFQSGNASRWQLEKLDDAESGSDAGGTLRLFGYNDAGAQIGSVFEASRVNGGSVTFYLPNSFQGKTTYTPSSLQTLSAGNAVSANATRVRVVGNGGAVTLTSTPTIADGSDGQLLYVFGTSDSNTLAIQDEAALVGSNVQLGVSTNRTLGLGDILTLMFDSTAGYWYEVSFTNN